MTLYVLDTDHMSLLDRSHPIVVKRVVFDRVNTSNQLATTAISFEEQIKGRLTQIKKTASNPIQLVAAYKRLTLVLDLYVGINILDYGTEADSRFRAFRKAGIRIGTQDLRIASIVLSSGGVMVTRNQRDFEKCQVLR